MEAREVLKKCLHWFQGTRCMKVLAAEIVMCQTQNSDKHILGNKHGLSIKERDVTESKL